uniref:Uncharacterized protein n=1 Tax=Helianthus annuus TaxID=4232 RepID=A0A251UM51_HELAN
MIGTKWKEICLRGIHGSYKKDLYLEEQWDMHLTSNVYFGDAGSRGESGADLVEKRHSEVNFFYSFFNCN